MQIDEQRLGSDIGKERTSPVLGAKRAFWDRRPAGNRRRHMFTAALAISLAVSMLVGMATRVFLNRTYRDVTSEIPSLINGADRVTAIAWSPHEFAALFVGTQLGKLYQIDGSDRALTLPGVAKGPIVSIYPVADFRAIPRTVWLDPESSEAQTPYRAEESPTLSGLAALAGSELRPIDNTPKKSGVLTGGKTPSQQTAPSLPTSGDPDFSDNVITSVGSIRISELLLDEGSKHSHATAIGYRDGLLRVIDSRDQSLVWTFRPDGGSADASPRSGTSSRSIVAIATRPINIEKAGLAFRRHVVPGTALFATASADGEVKVFRASSSGSYDDGLKPFLMAASVQRILMAPDGPQAQDALATGEVSIRPSKDGLWLSDDGRILMMYGPGGLVIADLTERSSSAPQSFRRFRPEALLAKRTPPSERDAPVLKISAATLSPRGDLFAVAGNDGVIRVVSLPSNLGDVSRANQLIIRGHGDIITHLAVSTDGRYLASSSVDGRVYIVDMERARQLPRWRVTGAPSGPIMPEMSSVPFEAPAPQSEQGFIIVLSANDTLAAAQAEIARATVAGFKDLRIYQWRGKYNSVARYQDKNAQLAGLLQLRKLPRWSRLAYPDFLSRRCLSPTEDQGFTRCHADSLPAAPCEEERNVRSRAGTTSASIVFSNRRANAVLIYWIDYGGARKFYGKLEHGQSLSFQTYITHPWIVADLDDKCLGIYMPMPTNSEVAVR